LKLQAGQSGVLNLAQNADGTGPLTQFPFVMLAKGDGGYCIARTVGAASASGVMAGALTDVTAAPEKKEKKDIGSEIKNDSKKVEKTF
jgi:hypothetical protein